MLFAQRCKLAFMFASLHHTLEGEIRAERKLIMQNLNLNLKNDSPVEQKFPEYPLQNHTATDYNFFSQRCVCK